MVADIPKVVDIETVLQEVNRFGVFHVTQYILAFLPVLFTAMSSANYVFSADKINYRCLVPDCENSTSSIAIPDWWPEVSDPHCTRPSMKTMDLTNTSICDISNFNEQVERCNFWVYESNYSIVSEFDLACTEWKRTLVGTVHNVGVLVSMIVLGYVSDRWGRRTAVILSAVGLGVGAFKTMANGYNLYVGLEFLEAAFGAAIYTSTYVLVIELGGKERRVISTAFVGVTIALGEVILALITWLVPYWRTFLLFIYCPTLLFLSYIILLKESIRWLLINGKTKKARRIIETVAKMNKIEISPYVLTALDGGTVVSDKECTTSVEEFNLKLLFSSGPMIKRLVVCSWWWFSSAFIYYGLMINSVSLPGNKYFNFGLTSLASVPGDIIAMFLLDKFGRKKTLMFGFSFCGIFCVAKGFIPQDATGVGLAVFLLGKCTISLCFNGVYVYTSELFPTSARSSLVGACSMFARIGSIIAPLTPLLLIFWSSLPTVLFGCVALTAASLMLFTPETLNQELPDTMAQAERLEKIKS